MAVKATDQITMTDLTDVKSVCRYYLLQSSTLATPSKPTTNPPSSSWTKTEPSYTAGSTNSLYFTDLTVYSNDTFDYSDVSLSSSYEAAKTAYNKAVEAAKAAKNSDEKATKAEKTATDYLEFTEEGLSVGNVHEQTFEKLSDGENKTVVVAVAGDVIRIKPPNTSVAVEYSWRKTEVAEGEIVLEESIAFIPVAAGTTGEVASRDIVVDGNYTYTFPADFEVYIVTNQLDKNVLINSEGIDIRKGKTVLASFYEKLIELGKNAIDSVISLCGGKGKISYDVNQKHLRIISDNIDVCSEALETGDFTQCSVGSDSNNASYHSYSHFCSNACALDTSARLALETTSQSYETDTSKNACVYVAASEDTSEVEAWTDEFRVVSNDKTVKIKNGRVILQNGYALQGEDADGTGRALVFINSLNNVQVGNYSVDYAHSGDTYVNAMNGTVVLRCSASSVELFPYDGTNVNSYFRPTVTDVVGLGSASYKWYRLYQYADTVSTSDEREKHDVVEMKDDDALEMLFDRLIPKTYRLNGEKEEKTHIGFVAQDVSKSLEEIGLHESAFGLINHEYWTDEETGEQKDEYGLAYSEFIALNTHMIQKLRKENEDLKARLAKIEKMMGITN